MWLKRLCIYAPTLAKEHGTNAHTEEEREREIRWWNEIKSSMCRTYLNTIQIIISFRIQFWQILFEDVKEEVFYVFASFCWYSKKMATDFNDYPYMNEAYDKHHKFSWVLLALQMIIWLFVCILFVHYCGSVLKPLYVPTTHESDKYS